MPIVTSTRSVPGSTAFRNSQWWLNGTKQATDRYDDYIGSQTTTSFRSSRKDGQDDYEGLTGEELYRRVRVEYQTRYDNGHDFTTQKSYFHYPSMVWYAAGQTTFPFNGFLEYRGPLRPMEYTNNLFPPAGALNTGQLNLIGNQLSAGAAPTASEASLMQFLAELKTDGLPKVSALKELIMKPSGRAAGQAHVEQQFSLKPFQSDLQKIVRSVLHACKRMKQYARDSDRIVRRKRHLDTVSNAVNLGRFGGDLGFPRCNLTGMSSTLIGGSSGVLVSDLTTTDTWFSGAYTYHLSEALGFLGNLGRYEELANKLLGSDITVETIWNLTPWTWLTDWFVDIGGFLHNVSLFHSNQLVMRYGYVMSHTVATRQRSMINVAPISNKGVIESNAYVSYATVESKQRRRATPYGFGLIESSFSDYQWAILGALGLSKSPKTLRRNDA
uniref:Maturation n=1 Tax=Leviviridae sp. TaxID=2027243 RepID=A0A514D6K1_9VIRU|nr:MAG: hypothetical protein H1Rhizo26FD522_000001 [Leviviridae sp.]